LKTSKVQIKFPGKCFEFETMFVFEIKRAAIGKFETTSRKIRENQMDVNKFKFKQWRCLGGFQSKFHFREMFHI
jgi:hypothetical protein